MTPPTTLDVTALILAGGRGQRLGGRNKALLRVAGVTLIDRLAAELRPRVARLLVSVAAPASWTALPTVIDERAGLGPLAGIAAGLARAPQWLLAVAVDMPYLSGDVLQLLLTAASDARDRVDAVAFRRGGWPEPLVALWGPACRPVVERRLAAGVLKVGAALQDPELRVHWIEEDEVRRVDPTLRAFRNVNDAEDVAAL